MLKVPQMSSSSSLSWKTPVATLGMVYMPNWPWEPSVKEILFLLLLTLKGMAKEIILEKKM